VQRSLPDKANQDTGWLFVKRPLTAVGARIAGRMLRMFDVDLFGTGIIFDAIPPVTRRRLFRIISLVAVKLA
jgi:hypothetical protein